MADAQHSSAVRSTVRAAIKAIEYHLPEAVLDNRDLAREFVDWSADKIEAKTGIRVRHVARADECASDLGVLAARKLLASGVCNAADIDFLLFCTQSPDYLLPTTACLMQSRLGLGESCGALDFNLGCSGYIYGLGLAKGLIESGQARQVLLVTADTYTKFIHPQDRSVRTLFGDAAAATLVGAVSSEDALLGPFVYGTDGTGAANLIVPTGGMRRHVVENAELTVDTAGNKRTVNNLQMNGPEIFNFTLRVVPRTVSELLRLAGKRPEDIDHFVFHQANEYMLEHLRKKLLIPPEKFSLNLRDCGNTVSSSIPIALRALHQESRLKPGGLLMLVGFGVGYSWGATLARWSPLNPPALPDPPGDPAL
ncbi:MAG: ketoacyl-ACP synthase III [Verrucomicrobiota bacterium]|jgi:3-oxoacyl-[acyl-carrier-protein] synthase-3